jgi:hypothetical protein
MADLSKVSIGIKTFLRDEMLVEAIAGIRSWKSDCQIVIADDGRLTKEKQKLYSELRQEGHIVGEFPFDSGFGMKSNWIAKNFTREYLLVASDDFDFYPLSVFWGLERLIDILDYTDVDIASGRVNDHPYEFDLEDLGDMIIEHPVATLTEPQALWFTQCDLTVNYSLIKRRVFEKVGWMDEAKIGQGEHGVFFLDCKRTGFKTAYVPRVNINTQRKPDPPEYKRYRSRAASPERLCFVKRGIKTYVLGNGQVDYQE